jgi:hypothetical protein
MWAAPSKAQDSSILVVLNATRQDQPTATLTAYLNTRLAALGLRALDLLKADKDPVVDRLELSYQVKTSRNLYVVPVAVGMAFREYEKVYARGVPMEVYVYIEEDLDDAAREIAEEAFRMVRMFTQDP